MNIGDQHLSSQESVSIRKETLIQSVNELMGFEAPHIRHVLKVLAHPLIIADTLDYFESLDASKLCEVYEAPWSCVNDYQARFDNMRQGFLGADHVDSKEALEWCDPCQRKGAAMVFFEAQQNSEDELRNAIGVYWSGDKGLSPQAMSDSTDQGLYPRRTYKDRIKGALGLERQTDIDEIRGMPREEE